MGKFELIMETEMVCMFSPKYDGEKMSEFENFLLANNAHVHPQLKRSFDAILTAIDKMRETGACERYFRLEGGNVKAIPLYISFVRVNRTVGKLRLYCLRLSDKILILGGGAVTTAQKNEDDPVLLRFIDDLRDIDQRIKRIVKQADTNFEDFVALKRIIETITL